MLTKIKNWFTRSSVQDAIDFNWGNLDELLRLHDAAGVKVNADTILGNPAVKKGLEVICGSISQVPFKVYRNEGNNAVKATSHPAYRLLTQQPSQNVPPMIWKHCLLMDAIIWGNGYSYIFRDDFGSPTELMWLDPSATWYDTNEGVYKTTISTRNAIAQPQDVIHIRSLSNNGGVSGQPLFNILRTSLGLGLATIEHGATYFKNSASPTIAVEVPEAMARDQTKYDEYKATWLSRYQGVKNAHLPGFIPQGTKIHPIQSSNQDSQWTQAREVDLVAVANALNLPASWVNSNTNISYKSLVMDQQNLLFVALGPWLTQLDQELTLKLCSPRQLRLNTHWIEAERKALVQNDGEKEIKLIIDQVSYGLLSWQEGRELLNRHTNQKEGDFFLVSTLTPAFQPEPQPQEQAQGTNLLEEEEPQKEPQEAPEDEDESRQAISQERQEIEPAKPTSEARGQDERLHKLTTEVVRKLVNRVTKALEAHAKKDDWQGYISKLQEEHGSVAKSQLEPAYGNRAAQVVDSWLSELQEELEATSRADLDKIIARQIENIEELANQLGA